MKCSPPIARSFLVLACALVTGALAQTTPTPATPPTPAAAPAPATTAPAPKVPAANYVIAGNLYYEQGKFDQAYVAFRAANEIDPRNTAALLGLGRSQVKLRLYIPAIATLKKLVQLAPQDISGYIALSQAYQQQFMGNSDRAAVSGNLAAALKVLQDAEAVVNNQTGDERNLNLSKVLNDRGSVYRLQGDATKAIDAFKQASLLNPDNSLILYNLGDMYAATGNLPLAISSLQQAVITDPRDAYNRAYYAKLLALSGNTSAAKPEAAQAAKLAPIIKVVQNDGSIIYLAKNPAAPYAVGQYGVVSYLAKDPTTARAQLTLAIKVDTLRFPEFYYYLGRLDLDAGDIKTARENFTKAAALGSTTPEYLYYLGLSYERGAGVNAPDKLKAKDNYERALKLNPNYKAAQDALNRVK